MSVYIINPGSSGGGGGTAFQNTQRASLVTADGNSATTPNQWGDNITLAGSSVNETPTSTAGAAIGIFAGATNTVVGINGRANYRTGRNIKLLMLAGAAGKITDQRWWFGLTDQTLSGMGGSDTPAGNYAAFRFSTQASDTVWQAATKDGTTLNLISTGVAPVINTAQSFAIIFNDSVPNVQFYINGTLVATSTTHLPSAGTNLQVMFTSECFASTTSNGMTWEQWYVLSDF